MVDTSYWTSVRTVVGYGLIEDRQKRLETLQGLGKALSTRVTPEINLDEPEMGGAELKKDLVFLILQVLLRLILKV